MRRIACALAAALIGSAALANGPFVDVPAGPRALPGDKLPPFGMLDGAGHLPPPPVMPPPTGAARADAPETTARALPMAAALRGVAAAVRACAAHGARVGASVVDASGEARAMLSADGSDGSHVFVAMRKAQVSVVFGLPSSAVDALVRHDPAQMAKVSPAMFVEGGAVPIYAHGVLLGAIGVSGARGFPIGHADEACAQAGLAAALR